MSSDSDHFEGDSDSDNELDLTLPFNPADHRASSPSAVIVNEGTKSPCPEKQDDTEQTRDINAESPQTNVQTKRQTKVQTSEEKKEKEDDTMGADLAVKVDQEGGEGEVGPKEGKEKMMRRLVQSL